MTKKDYTRIAEVLRHVWQHAEEGDYISPSELMADVVDFLAESLYLDDPNFDKDTFRKAIYGGQSKMGTPKVIKIDDTEYVRLKDLPEAAEDQKGLPYKIVRTYSAGVFAGYIESSNGQEVVILKARRLWHWEGAATLSQLATEGTKNPKQCKFPCTVSRVKVLEAIELLDCTKRAQKSIEDVPIWEK